MRLELRAQSRELRRRPELLGLDAQPLGFQPAELGLLNQVWGDERNPTSPSNKTTKATPKSTPMVTATRRQATNTLVVPNFRFTP
ncbi:hypothetical protein POL68_17675 [Stigmatella sp. ncwal1]|uniref:Uncharacterized protein n=1 Tax=Stigmatella ashevillensis TaxID=2995309 RepID=A0ABT5D9F3_9BACT|nr:hypothetical protein [Stigmatella ashevillena]MDC0710310.1 hypothetical protein [Stigmatella ashevillena]